MRAPINKVLVAGRGESANRLVRTLRRMGLRTVAVYTEAEARGETASEADEWLPLGPLGATHDRVVKHVLAAALDTGADAVHPGYGVLREGTALAEACERHGLLYVGAPLAALRALADKVAAREAATSCSLPVVPGSGTVVTADEATQEAEQLGYPVLVKPLLGGGGVGLHLARDAAELAAQLEVAVRESESLCGDARLYLERWLPGARLIDVQVAADRTGSVVHLGARATLAEHRYLRLFEEAPAPGLDAALAERLADAALRLARHVGLVGLATVEFLVDGDAFYFLEMNTRLQTEHSLTEMLAGVDLVEWQVRLALGEPVPARQSDITLLGHAIQCRLYPHAVAGAPLVAGRIRRLEAPLGPGLRHDFGIDRDAWVSPYEAPLIAKLIAHGETRKEALTRLRAALADYVIEGTPSNLDVLRRIALDASYEAGALEASALTAIVEG